MLTDQDRKAAEELIDNNLEGHSYTFPVINKSGAFENIVVPVEAIKSLAIKFALLGIELERKGRKYYEVKFSDDLVTVLNEETYSLNGVAPLTVGGNVAPLTVGPLEQVGERHWRIKDGHE